MLAGPAPGARLLEIRFALRYRDMGRLFIAAHSAPGASRLIRRLAARTDVYVGVCLRTPPRRRPRRDRPLAPRVRRDRHARRARPTPRLPASADHDRAPRAAAGHAHAYFTLSAPVTVPELERANRRLAHALGGDLASVDAARILRPPSSWNHKHSPPTPVELVELDPGATVRPRPSSSTDSTTRPATPTSARRRRRRAGRTEIDRLLLAIPAAEYVHALTGLSPDRAGKIHCPFHELSVGEATAGAVMPARSHADASSRDRASADPLLLVPPPVYFERLTGMRVGRSGKLRCLFHDDRHPSLHVYQEAGRGWYCFGCGRGGSVYDLAALLWGRKTRGVDFVELRRELEKLLLL